MGTSARMNGPKFLIGLTLAGLAVALVIIAFVPPVPREPIYQGKTLRPVQDAAEERAGADGQPNASGRAKAAKNRQTVVDSGQQPAEHNRQ